MIRAYDAIELWSDTEAHIGHYPPDTERLVWCDWLRRHSIDPNDVAAPGTILRWPAERRVSYLAYAVDADGNLIVHDGYEVEYVEHVVQLESEPAPFPEVPK